MRTMSTRRNGGRSKTDHADVEHREKYTGEGCNMDTPLFVESKD